MKTQLDLPYRTFSKTLWDSPIQKEGQGDGAEGQLEALPGHFPRENCSGQKPECQEPSHRQQDVLGNLIADTVFTGVRLL